MRWLTSYNSSQYTLYKTIRPSRGPAGHTNRDEKLKMRKMKNILFRLFRVVYNKIKNPKSGSDNPTSCSVTPGGKWEGYQIHLPLKKKSSSLHMYIAQSSVSDNNNNYWYRCNWANTPSCQKKKKQQFSSY